MKRLALLLLVTATLPCCRLIPDVAGVVAAAGSGSASANPAVGIAVGIAVRSATRELLNYIDRRRQGAEQDAIAEAAGAAPIGTSRAWQIRHTIPFGNAHGELEPVREYATPLTTCRDIAFTVVDGDERELFTTSLCQQDGRWRWAQAEPAVPRWGSLQ